MPKIIQFGRWEKGLGALGKLEQDKLQTLQNAEVHDEIGIVKPQYALEVKSTTPNEPCFSTVDNSGNTYFCSKTTGNMWKRTAGGTYSALHTNVNSVHTGCKYFNGYLWYWTATKLGRYDLVSTYSDSYATGTAFREGIEANNSLLITNGRYTARVDSANTFSANEFVAPAQFKQTCLKNIGDDVLIGTYISTDVSYCKVFLWNTVSPSYTYEDEVFEIGINCFIQLDNMYLAQCGVNGAFYYWTGSRMAFFGEIRGITTALGEQMSAVLNRRPLFANGNKVYSIFSRANGLPTAFVQEYTLTTGTTASITVQGQNLLISNGTGIEGVSTSLATTVIETAEIQDQITNVVLKYDTYPEGISMQINTNGSGYVSKTARIDTVKREIFFDGGVKDGYTSQVKITLTPSGANRPSLKSVIFLLTQ